MNKLFALLLALTVSSAFAFHCPADMKAIDDKIATGVKLPEADMAKVKQLRAEGEAAHKAGRHDESVKLLAQARKLLGI